ncbi:MAG: efflux RND transporter periplasmic adaptor subunit [Planctomycetes bacterium]|nr:efflux RND transporter periplasmic adaptor subunit [Planctomycetota bacterium]
MAGAGLVAALVYAFRPQPVPVDTERVTRGPLLVTVDEDGRTRIRERYVVSSPLAGRLSRIQLKPGDAVKAGNTTLALIEPADPSLLDARARAEAQARVNAATAAIEQAKSNSQRAIAALEAAQTDFRRAQALVEKRSISQDEFEEAQLQLRTKVEEARSAGHAVQIAQYELELAQAALLRTDPQAETSGETWRMEIDSPINGRVLRVMQESAGIVTAGTPLIEVGDPQDLEVVVDVLSSDAVKIAPGDRALLEHWGGPRPLEGRVRLVEPSGFTKISALGVEEQRVNVIIDFVAPPAERPSLGDAYRVEARVIVDEAPSALKVPNSATFRSGDEWAVFVVSDGRAVVRPVKLGRRNEHEAEVLGGVADGDLVIVHPSDKVTAGVAVEPR